MQAPGSCSWYAVRDLIAPYSKHFLGFAGKSLEFKPLQSLVNYEIDRDSLGLILRRFVGSTLQPRSNNERMIQPIVHQTLDCAAVKAEKISGHPFTVVSEPSIYLNRDDWVGDEAVIESVLCQHQRMKILMEIKGRGTFPFDVSSRKGLLLLIDPFSQLMYETALALLCNLWKEEITVGLATAQKWYLFRVMDASENEAANIQLRILESSYCDFNSPERKDLIKGPYDEANAMTIDALAALTHSLCQRLCGE